MLKAFVTIDQTRNSGASNEAQFTYEMNIPTPHCSTITLSLIQFSFNLVELNQYNSR